jgi:glycosyltransferase involved in cell wall biosynthesis
MAAVPLSVVIITFNEEDNIGRCLDSVRGIADDVIVLDSFSEDRTCEIAREKGARVFQQKFAGHIEQKNNAIRLAQFPHILSLDADEAPDEELQNAILKVKADFACDGYRFNRMTCYAGQWIRFGGWYPDRKLRLWDSRKGKWAGLNPHDRFEMEAGCQLGYLPGKLLHYSYSSREAHHIQTEKFAAAAALALFRQGRKASFDKRFLSPVFRFFYSYLLKLGFLEGRAGFDIAWISARASFLKYQKLHQLHQSGLNDARRA